MSKSLGNFFTLRDLVGKGFTGREVRRVLASSHYRETFNFTMKGLEDARVALARLDECLQKLVELAGATPVPAGNSSSSGLVEDFARVMDEDFNIAGAWGVIFEWVRETNRRVAAGELTSVAAATALAQWEKVDGVLGLGRKESGESIPADIQALLEQRQAARKAKDFARSDVIRDQLKASGWLIEDTPKGPKLKKA